MTGSSSQAGDVAGTGPATPRDGDAGGARARRASITPDDAKQLGFSAVDGTADPGSLIAALDEQASLPAIQRLRARATELLHPQPGQRLLDAGCGTGDVTRSLAAMVGPRGVTVGVDPSTTMLAEARRRSADPEAPVQFRLGDLAALDFEDRSFDGAYCERVFQHLTQPDAAMAELARVTRAGGRIVVIDTDWGMHAINGADPDLTARVVRSWAGSVPNGWSGRRLPALFASVGIGDVTVLAETYVTTDAPRATTEPITTMAAAAVGSGALQAAEADAWLEQLADAGTGGRFMWAFTMLAVGGTRP